MTAVIYLAGRNNPYCGNTIAWKHVFCVAVRFQIISSQEAHCRVRCSVLGVCTLGKEKVGRLTQAGAGTPQFASSTPSQ